MFSSRTATTARRRFDAADGHPLANMGFRPGLSGKWIRECLSLGERLTLLWQVSADDGSALRVSRDEPAPRFD